MRTLLLLAVVAACGTTPTPPIATPPAPIAPPALVKLDDATVVANSHAFLDAYDRADVDGVAAPLGASFVFFADGRFNDRVLFAKRVQSARDRHLARTRTWSDEHVYATPTSAIFIGNAIEHIPGEADHPAAEAEGYNTLVWVREAGAWKLAAWERVRAGLDAEREFWDEAFRIGTSFNHEPNQLLVDTLKGKKPGRALDVLMGQGRNAIYEASQGWKVTGVDISREGMKIASAEAARRKLALETIDADIDKWDPGVDRWDLVTMIYAGDSAPLVERLKPSMRHGALFILEYFHADSEAAKTGAGGWKTGQLAALFKDGFTIVRDEVVDDRADYGMRTQKLVRFVAKKN